MERILVPVDFSLNAEKALGYAIEIARKSRAEVLVLHVAEAYLVPGAIEEARSKLELLTASIRDGEHISISSSLQTGSPASAILETTGSFKPDLVVMGTLGSSGTRELLYGSRTAEVIGKSPVPVLAIPLLGDWKVPSKIVLALNKFDEVNDELLEPIFSLATLFGAEVQVATFTDTADDYVEDYDLHEQNVAICRDQLKMTHKGIEIHAVHLAGRHFTKSLRNWIETNNIDLLTMITHRRGAFESIFNRSVTKKMLYHTNIPLLAIPVAGK